MRWLARVVLRELEFIGSTSLEECLLIAKDKLFVGLVFFFDRVADHADMMVENKSYSGILWNHHELSNFFHRKK